ncbi:hypothetical protein TNCV_721511 [Trichonephila clavipes]|nr:hypothetical protein TNCV_721511 [Trichonephila clavipes]
MIDEDSDPDIDMPTKKTDDISDLLADSDSDLPDDDDEVPKTTQKSRRKKIQAPRLEENAEDDIVDLLDPAVNKRLLTVKENKSHQKKRSDDFLISEDGRLIIEDKDEDENTKSKMTKEKKMKYYRNWEYLLRGSDDEDDHEVEPGSISHVSKGIHRTLEPKAKRRRPGEEFKKGPYQPLQQLSPPLLLKALLSSSMIIGAGLRVANESPRLSHMCAMGLRPLSTGHSNHLIFLIGGIRTPVEPCV